MMLAVQADASLENNVEELFQGTCSQLGRPTALVNNAGILFAQSKLIDLDAKRINAVLATNVTGCFLCAKHAVRLMSTELGGSGGAIVNLSSAAARLLLSSMCLVVASLIPLCKTNIVL